MSMKIQTVRWNYDVKLVVSQLVKESDQIHFNHQPVAIEIITVFAATHLCQSVEISQLGSRGDERAGASAPVAPCDGIEQRSLDHGRCTRTATRTVQY
jgi:hypothetical protein